MHRNRTVGSTLDAQTGVRGVWWCCPTGSVFLPMWCACSIVAPPCAMPTLRRSEALCSLSVCSINSAPCGPFMVARCVSFTGSMSNIPAGDSYGSPSSNRGGTGGRDVPLVVLHVVPQHIPLYKEHSMCHNRPHHIRTVLQNSVRSMAKCPASYAKASEGAETTQGQHGMLQHIGG